MLKSVVHQVCKRVLAACGAEDSNTQFSMTFLATFIIQAFMLCTGVVIARLLGPHGRGEFDAIILWPVIIAQVGLFGVNVSLGRRQGQDAKANALLGLIIPAGLITSCVSLGVTAVALPKLLPTKYSGLLLEAVLFSSYIVIYQFLELFGAIDQVRGKFIRLNTTRVVSAPLYLGCVVIVALLGSWYEFPVTAGIVSCLFVLSQTGALLTRVLMEPEKSLLLNIKIKETFRLFVESIPFGLSGAFFPVYLLLDKVLVLWLATPTELGLYSVGVTAGGVLKGITISSGIVAFGHAARDTKKIDVHTVLRLFRQSAVLWIVGSAVLIPLLPFLVRLVYGAAFEDSGLLAMIALFSFAAAGLMHLLDQALRAQGRAYAGFESRAVGSVLMIVMALNLYPRYGVLGVALATCAAQLACLLVLIFRFVRHYSVQGEETAVVLAGQLLPRRQDFAGFFLGLSRLFRP